LADLDDLPGIDNNESDKQKVAKDEEEIINVFEMLSEEKQVH
jgi:hypothetical protein